MNLRMPNPEPRQRARRLTAIDTWLRFPRAIGGAPVWIVVIATAFAAPVRAEIVCADGDVVATAVPSNADGVLDTACRIWVFEERQGRALAAALTVQAVEPGLYDAPGALVAVEIPAGTRVKSHYVYASGCGSTVSGSVTFDDDILGVIVTTGPLNASNGLGATAVSYPTLAQTGAGFELSAAGDRFTIEANHRTLTLVASTVAESDGDQLRVITAAAPDYVPRGWSRRLLAPRSKDAHVAALFVRNEAGVDVLYAGGQFSTAGGSTQVANIARYNGSSWSALGGGINGKVHALAEYNGELIAAGVFSSAGGIPVNNIARWNGAAWAPLGAGLPDDVSTLAVYNGELYAGGAFSSAGGRFTGGFDRLARWNGTTWNSVGAGFNNAVVTLAVHDGALYIGGAFTFAGSNFVARWDGATLSGVGGGMGNGVNALVSYNGALHAGTLINPGASAWMFDGVNWQALGAGLSSHVYEMCVHNGELYALGMFGNINGVGAANHIARWNGLSWSAAGTGVPAAARLGENCAMASFGGNLILSAMSQGYDSNIGSPVPTESAFGGLGRWNGSDWATYASGVSHEQPGAGGLHLGPFAMTALNGDLFGVGVFNHAGDTSARNAARFNLRDWSGPRWSALGSGLTHTTYWMENPQAVSTYGSSVVALGTFTHAGGAPASNIAAWNGASWSALGAGLDAVGYVALEHEGSLYVGGAFNNAGGVAAPKIARWDGAQWHAVGGSVTAGSYVIDLAVFEDELVACGAFTEIGGVSAAGIARWNGMTWTSMGAADGLLIGVQSYAGKLYLGGRFRHIDSVPAAGIAAWDGATWSAVGRGIDLAAQDQFIGVQDFAVHDGELIVSGNFASAGGSLSPRIARWNGCTWLPVERGLGLHSLYDVVSVDDGLGSGPGLYVSGAFWTTGDSDTRGLVRWGRGAGASRLYVDADASPGGDGESWAGAFQTLQQALTVAEMSGGVVSEIWMAEGVYRPAGPGGNREASFVLVDGVSIYGGFAGTEADLSERTMDPGTGRPALQTVLSGDLNGNDGPNFTGRSENSLHVLIASGVSAATVMDGLVVRGGNADLFTSGPAHQGGGLFAQNGSPTIENSLFTSNRAGDGGAMWFDGFCAVTLRNVEVSDNSGFTSRAGVVLSGNSGGPYAAVLIEDCLIARNVTPATVSGTSAGVNVQSAAARIQRCTFEENTAGRGSALSVSGGAPIIVSECTFSRNVASGPTSFCVGGAIRLSNLSAGATVQNCRFYGNLAQNGADGRAGAISITNDSPSVRVVNCAFVGNGAENGGAILSENTSSSIRNCTFVDNRATVSGGAMRMTHPTTNGSLWNSVLWANSDSGGSVGGTSQVDVAGGAANVSYSLVSGGFSGAGNLDANPQFVRLPSPGLDGNWDGVNDDYGDLRPQSASPAIDAGSNALVGLDGADMDNDGNVAEATPFDLGRRPRFREIITAPNVGAGTAPLVDMGAYESFAGPVLVDASPSGQWPESVTSLQEALAFVRQFAPEASEIWIADGVYRPDDHAGVITPGDRDASFDLPEGVALYGGFSGNETARAQRNPALYVSVLSGDLLGDDSPSWDARDGLPANITENSRHVVTVADRAEVTLDGLTITGGFADAAADVPHGGGLFWENSGGLLRDVRVVRNVAAEQGGGAMIRSLPGSPLRAVLVEACTVESNLAAAGSGGGLHVSMSTSTASIRETLFEHNHAAQGGALSIHTGTTGSSVRDCAFTENQATGDGGALVLQPGTSAIAVVSCGFLRNAATGAGADGGAFAMYSGIGRLINCRFYGNMAGDRGGAIRGPGAFGASTFEVVNGAFVGNSARLGGAVANSSADQPGSTSSKYMNCTIVNNVATEFGGGMWNGEEDSGSITPSSPEVRNGIFWKNSDSQPAGSASQILTVSGSLSITDSIIYGGWSNANLRVLGLPPHFVRYPSPGADGQWDGVDDDYGDLRLYRGSPAINRARTIYIPADVADIDGNLNTTEPTPLDADGNSRFINDACMAATGTGTGALADLGAFERVPAAGPSQAILFVDASATGANDGTSWGDAYTDLAEALCLAANAGGVQEVWVASGTYVPSSRQDRADTISLPPNIAVYGGFAGHETLRSQRDAVANQTILSGDLHGDDDAGPYDPAFPPPLTWSENSIHVVSAVEATGWRLDGFTITRGHAGILDVNERADDGAGIYLRAGAGTIANCRVVENVAVDAGGGIHASRISPTLASQIVLTDCTVERNRAARGGAVSYLDGTGVLERCVLRNNRGTFRAGGAELSGDGLRTLRDCEVSENFGASAGGLHIDGNADIITTRLERNVAGSGAGGGANCFERTIRFYGCRFLGNTAAVAGGGAIRAPRGETRIGTLVVANCEFVGNTAPAGGAILIPQMVVAGSTASIVNCTFSENIASGAGGGINCGGSGSSGLPLNPVIANSLFWNNRDSGGSGSAAQIAVALGAPLVDYSLVGGGWVGGTENVSGDPLFRRAPNAGPGGLWDGVNDDYGDLRLGYRSAALDAGDVASLPADAADVDRDGNTAEPLPLDLAGAARVVDIPCSGAGGEQPGGAVDIGAREAFLPAPQRVVYVDADASGADDGTSWSDAYNDLNWALCAASAAGGVIEEIWIAEGEYVPTFRRVASATPQQRALSFELPSNVALLGGFAGGELAAAQRSTDATRVVLSGDLVGDDDEFDFPDGVTWGDNSLHVLATSSATGTLLDTLTIRGGNADGGSGADANGGGLLLTGSATVSLANCRLTLNSAGLGGGLHASNTSEATLTGCTLLRNHARDDGGAVYVASASSSGFSELRDCTLERNTAVDGGGAVWAAGVGRMYIIGSMLRLNAADRGGGAFAGGSGGALHVVSSTFEGNAATQYGGGLALVGASPLSTITNGVFVGNATFDNSDGGQESGAGVYLHAGGLTITNSTFAYNTAYGTSAVGGGIHRIEPAPLTVANSIFWGNLDGSGVTSEAQVRFGPPSSPSILVSHSTVQGGFPGTGASISSADPLFRSTPAVGVGGFFADNPATMGVDESSGANYGNLRLADNGTPSPAIDAGSDMLLVADVADVDCDGNRVEMIPLDRDAGIRRLDFIPGDAVVDQGAYETGAGVLTRIYVNAGATPGGDGATWETAFDNLRDALAASVAGGCAATEFWVARGTYMPDGGRTPFGGAHLPSGAPDRSATFQLVNGFVLLGGFVGNETSADQRNPKLHITTLSGDLDGDGFAPGENSHHVVTGTATDAGAILDGFTITGGAADNAPGAGFLAASGGPLLRNCRIEGSVGACAPDFAVSGAVVALDGVSISAAGGGASAAQSTLDVQGGLFLQSGSLHSFGNTITGPGTVHLDSGSTLRVAAGPACGSALATAAGGALGAVGAGAQVFSPASAELPERWEISPPGAALHDWRISGPTRRWIVAPTGLDGATLTWSASPLVTDLSSGGRADGRFAAGGVVEVSGAVYDETGGSPVHLYTGLLLRARVSAFRVRETSAGSDVLEFVAGERPLLTPVEGFLLDNDEGFQLSGAQFATLVAPAALAPITAFGGAAAITLSDAAELSLAPANPVQGETVLRGRVSGTGQIAIDPGARLAIRDGGLIDLSGNSPGAICEDPSLSQLWGQIGVEGTLVVEDATIQNSKVEVALADLLGQPQIVHNDIRLIDTVEAGPQSRAFGGEFFVRTGATIRCNVITSFGDRYLDLDPDPQNRNPNIYDNLIRVIITQGANGSRGELLELRTQDFDHGVGGGASGAYPLANSAGYDDAFALDVLEVRPGAKVNLTNRQGFVFQPPGSPFPEALYVRQLILREDAVLNVGLQRLYYQSLVMESGARIVDIPVLGFSLKVIAMEDATEFDVRVRMRRRDPADVQPPAPPFREGAMLRVAAPIPPGSQNPVGDPSNHAMLMRTRDAGSGSLNAASVAAHGAFARAAEADVVVAFRYRFVAPTIQSGTGAGELVVYLADDPELRDATRLAEPGYADRFKEIARVRPPTDPTRPGGLSSGEFATFYGTFPRGALNFTRGTYVELELRGDDAAVLIDDWDPQIYCLACADLNGSQGVDPLDYLVLLSETGSSLDPLDPDANRPCLDAGLTGDRYVDLHDLLSWDTWLNGSQLNACGVGGIAGGCGAPATPVTGLTAEGLLIAGKPNSAGFEDRLFPVTLGGACDGAARLPASESDPAACHRSNGRLVRDAGGRLYQIHANQGLIRLDTAQAALAPGVDTSTPIPGATVRVGMQLTGPSPYGGIDFVGVPLLDVAFHPTLSDVVFVAPVIVTEPGDPLGVGRPYKAAAKLQLLGGGAFNVLEVYGTNPADPASGVSVNAVDFREIIYEPDYTRIREIDVDDRGNVYVLATQFVNQNNYLLIYTEGGGNASRRIINLESALPSAGLGGALLSGPSQILVSRHAADRLYLAQTVYEDATEIVRVARCSIVRSGDAATGISLHSVLDLNASAAAAGDVGNGYAALPVALVEHPADGRIFAVGYIQPVVSRDLSITDLEYLQMFGPGAGLASRAWLAEFSAAQSGAVTAASLGCNSLALPLSIEYVPPPAPPPQACCLTGGACQSLTAGACATAGGTAQGIGSVCTPNPCPPAYPPGDMNCDGVFNNFDIDPFVLALVDPGTWEANYPDCPISNGDMNGDNAFNNFDIDPFVNCLVNGCD
ncbi:MAG: right-handed parallel beta-helix repeat-containing protein [Phycisphaerales bacterium]|nr:right-handed parallel beta-helix repeat-containing protein [Phycisphaerales bacterium]